MKITETSDSRKKIEAAIKDLAKKRLRIGWFYTSKYEDGTPVAYVATIQEFGYPEGGIPARPFMRPTVSDKTTEWKNLLAAGSRQITSGKLTAGQMLGAFGMMAASNIKESITKVTTPPLADSTIAARAAKRKSPGVSTKPLIDTGLMLDSVSHKVEG